MTNKLEISQELVARAIHCIEHGTETMAEAISLAEELRGLSASTDVSLIGEGELPAAPAFERQEPIMMEAVAVVRESEDGLYLEWTLEGGIAALELAGTVLFASNDGNDMCAEDGSCEVYLQPPAQVEAGDDSLVDGTAALVQRNGELSAMLFKMAAKGSEVPGFPSSLMRDARLLLKAPVSEENQ